jgi:hypothetical protein
MAAIEFTSSPGKTFTVVVRDPANGYASLATGISCTEISATRYRATVGSLTGLVWIEATAGATKATGFADLDRPAANGYSDVSDSPSANSVITVLPGRDRAVADAAASSITVKLGEIITIARSVVDANGLPMDLSGFTNLQFVVQDARGLDLAVVAHASITISGTSHDTYSFVTPSGFTAKLGVFDFSLNQVGGGQIVGGKWIVLRRAVAG